MAVLAPVRQPRFLALGVLAVCLTLSSPSWGQTKVAPEYAVKAAYLYKFAPFVTWPPTAFSGPRDPFAICIVGRDPFGAALERAIAGQALDGRPIVVRRLARMDRRQSCQVLFASEQAQQPPQEAFRLARGAPILTVQDDAADDHGAIVRFVMRDNRVRFVIDSEAAAANGVTISSKLLSLSLPPRTP